MMDGAGVTDQVKPLRVLDICSGIGGMSLGLEQTNGFETVAFCEHDTFCRKVLKKHWPDVPMFNDLKELAHGSIPDHDIIAGGIPCQPFSKLGKKNGTDDDRYLWPFMFDIIKRKRPAFALIENVDDFIEMALNEVLTDLESEGYAHATFILPACGLNAPHKRDRTWIIAHADGCGQSGCAMHEAAQRIRAIGAEKRIHGGWGFEPAMDRMDDGVSAPMDQNRRKRLRALGRAVVPQLVTKIGDAILAQWRAA